MSYFNSGAARAYANNFRTWQPNGGWKNIKSDIGKTLFTEIPFVNFQAELDMAKAGLSQYGTTVRQKMVNENALEQLEKRQEFAKEQNKKSALIKLLSGGSGAARRGGAGSGVTSNDSLLQQAFGSDAVGDTIRDGQAFQKIESMVNADIADIAGAAAQGLRNTGTVPKSQRVELLQPGQSGTTAAPQAPALSSLKLDEQVFEEELAEIMKGLQGATEQ